MNIDQVIHDFVAKGMALFRIHSLDYYYVINRLLVILNKEFFETDLMPTVPLPSLLESMDQMVEYVVSKGIIQESAQARDELTSEIMDVLTPTPSAVNKTFWENYREAPMKATDEFYELCQVNDYIKTRDIAKNEVFTATSDYGDLTITINLSKPEKTKADILQAQKEVGDYPKCQLCAENEGYQGRMGIAGRSNHRFIRVPLEGKSWGFQYSPYSYYNEHCIVFTEEHIPMDVSHQTITNLLELVTVLPHYFMGSNAGLPIVGGSMLGHEHYQGGRHKFPMENARIMESWIWKNLPTVEAERLYWPLSVVRLRSTSKLDLIQAGSQLMDAWENYSNEALDILANTNGDTHNAVTLIARRKGSEYEMDVVLRNNRTTPAFPDGIFHPHSDVQHIKKENIGLIEVLGLAILPPRLKTELADVAAYLLNEKTQVASYHQAWADDLKQANTVTGQNVEQIIQKSVGDKFQRVLEDAGVFKQTEQGQHAFSTFVSRFK